MLLPMGDMVLQQTADWVIALAHFSIPIEIMYFFCKHPIFLDNRARLITSLFVSFISLCGITHAFHAVRDYHVMAFLREHSGVSVTDDAVAADPTVHHWTLVLSVSKVLTALVSVSTVFALMVIIPQVLTVARYIPELEEGLRRKIIELNEARAAAESANARKGEFMAFLCHEIRNPLHVITANIDFLIESANAAANSQPICQLERYVDDGSAGANAGAIMLLEQQQLQMQQQQLQLLQQQAQQQQQQSQPPTQGAGQLAEFDPLHSPDGGQQLGAQSLAGSSPSSLSEHSSSFTPHPSSSPLGSPVGDEPVYPSQQLSVQTGPVSSAPATASGAATGTGAPVMASAAYPLYVIRDGVSTSPGGSEQARDMLVASQRGLTPSTAPAAPQGASKRRTWPSVDYTPRMGDAGVGVAPGYVHTAGGFVSFPPGGLFPPAHAQAQSMLQQSQLVHMVPGQLSLEQRQYCRAINHAAELMVSICNDVLDIAKLESGVIVFEHLAVDLPLLCETFVSLSRPQAAARGINITLEWAAPPLKSRYVFCDPTRLHQVFLQLISNAIKFAKDGEEQTGAHDARPATLAEDEEGQGQGASLSDILRPSSSTRRRRKGAAGTAPRSEIKFRVRAWFPSEMDGSSQGATAAAGGAQGTTLSVDPSCGGGGGGGASSSSPLAGANGRTPDLSPSLGTTLGLSMLDSPRREPSPRMQALTTAAQAEAAEVVAAAQASAVPPLPLLHSLSINSPNDSLDSDGYPASERQALLSPPSSSSSSASASASAVAAAIAVQPPFAAFTPAAQSQYSRARTVANTVLSVNAKAIQAAAAAAASSSSASAVASPAAAHGSHTPPLHSRNVRPPAIFPGSSPVPNSSPPMRTRTLKDTHGHGNHSHGNSPSHGLGHGARSASGSAAPRSMPPLVPRSSLSPATSARGSGTQPLGSPPSVTATTHLQHPGAPAKPGYAAVGNRRGGCNTGLGRERLTPTVEDILASSASGSGSGSGGSGASSGFGSSPCPPSGLGGGGSGTGSTTGSSGRVSRHASFNSDQQDDTSGSSGSSGDSGAERAHLIDVAGGAGTGAQRSTASSSSHAPLGYDHSHSELHPQYPETAPSASPSSAAADDNGAGGSASPAPEYCWVQFEVIDNGVGMSAEVLRHVFLPYSEHKLRTYRSQGGTGLGLSICKEIVNQLEGELNVHSVEGEGSTFVVRLRFQIARQVDVLQAYFNAQGAEVNFDAPPPQPMPVPAVGSSSNGCPSSAAPSTANQSRRGSATLQHIIVETPETAAAPAATTASTSASASASASAGVSASPYGTPHQRTPQTAPALDLLSSPLSDSSAPASASAAASAAAGSSTAATAASIPLVALPSNGNGASSGTAAGAGPGGANSSAHMSANFAYMPFRQHMGAAELSGHLPAPAPQQLQLGAPTTAHSSNSSSGTRTPTDTSASPGTVASAARAHLRLTATPSSPYSGMQPGSVAALSSVATASPMSGVGASPLSGGLQLPPALASFPSHSGGPSSTPPHSNTSRSSSLSGSGGGSVVGGLLGSLNAPLHKILVVDDNEVNRKLLRRMMTSLAYEVDTAENGLLALEAVRKNMTEWPRPASLERDVSAAEDGAVQPVPLGGDAAGPTSTGAAATGTVGASLPTAAQAHQAQLEREYEVNTYSCIIMDLSMPVMNGYEATSAIRALGFTAPILALTANALTEERQKAFDAGCNEFCTKPIRKHELVQLMARFCAHDHPAQQAAQQAAALAAAVAQGHFAGRQRSSPSPSGLMLASGTSSGAHSPASSTLLMPASSTTAAPFHMSSTQPYANLGGAGSAGSSSTHSPISRLTGGGSSAELMQFPPLGPPGGSPRTGPTLPSSAHRLGSRVSSASSASSSGSNQFLSRPPLAVHPTIGSGGGGSTLSVERDRGSGGSSSGGSPMLFNLHGRSVSAASTPSARDGTQRHSADAVVGVAPHSGKAPTSAGVGSGGGSSSSKRGGSDGLLGPSGQPTAGGIPAVPRPSPPLLSPSGGSMNLRRQLMLERGYSASAASEASLNALPRSPRRKTIPSPAAAAATSPASGAGAALSPSSTASPCPPASASALLETPHGADSDVSSPASSNTASASPPVLRPIITVSSPATAGGGGGGVHPLTLSSRAGPSPDSPSPSPSSSGPTAKRGPTHARARSRGAINMGALLLGGGLNGTGAGASPPEASNGAVDGSLLSAIRAHQEHYHSLSPASQLRAIHAVDPAAAATGGGGGASPTSLLTPRHSPSLAFVAESKEVTPESASSSSAVGADHSTKRADEIRQTG